MKDEDGSIVVLAIGFLFLVLLTSTTAVDIASMWITRHSVDGIADGAALAGAQAVDVQSVYNNGIGPRLHIDPTGARQRVRAFVAATRDEVPGLEIVEVTTDYSSVRVTLRAPTHLPFGYLLPSAQSLVRSAACGVNDVR